MVDFSLTEEQLAIQKTAREFAEREVKPVTAEIDKIADPKEAWSRVRDIYVKANKLGFNKILIPQKYGGLGLTELDACLVIEELSVADAGIGTSYFVHTGQSRMLDDACTEEQKQEFFTACCNDPEELYFMAVSVTEHGAAGDLGPREYGAGRVAADKLTPLDFVTRKPIPEAQQREMTAAAKREGDTWIINGMKRFITFGRQAKLYCTLAMTNPAEADGVVASGFLVPAGTPGLSFGHVEDKMGHRLSENSEVIYEDVRIPEKWRYNWALSLKGSAYLNTCMSAISVGVARRAFEEAIAYAQTRYKGGNLIIFHQAVQRMLVDMAVDVKTARLLTWLAAWDDETTRSGSSSIANMAKVYSSDAAVDAANKGMQVFGGYGYMRDFPMEKLVRDTRLLQIYDESNEMLRHGQIIRAITFAGTA